MTLNAALWAGSTALTGKAAFALWVAAFLLQCFDHRKLVLGWQIVLTLCAAANCALGYLYASGPTTQWMWVGAGLIAVFSSVQIVRQWVRTSPRETFEEAAQLDSAIKKTSKAKKANAKKVDPASVNQLQKEKPLTTYLWLDIAGLALVATAVFHSIYAASPSFKIHMLLSLLHVIAASVLWGVAIFCAIELTFGSAPSSLSAVSWSGVSTVALVCWIAESCVAAFIVMSPVDSSADFQAVAMTRLFAISILLMDFVVWMIPHRVATFKRTGKATAWVSLSMAAWIGALSLAVLCALPSNWPWQHL